MPNNKQNDDKPAKLPLDLWYFKPTGYAAFYLPLSTSIPQGDQQVDIQRRIHSWNDALYGVFPGKSRIDSYDTCYVFSCVNPASLVLAPMPLVNVLDKVREEYVMNMDKHYMHMYRDVNPGEISEGLLIQLRALTEEFTKTCVIDDKRRLYATHS
jgi:hypothetical protein